MDNLTLVIMAAGMGSRFGGLKQIEPVGPSGEIIADYSVYDAIRAGFSKVIFIIRREHLDYFKEHITSKFEDQIKVEFAFQELDMIPSDVSLPEGRVKMLGTGHALYCAKDFDDRYFILMEKILDALENLEEQDNDDTTKKIYINILMRAFEMKTLHIAGISPHLDKCIMCENNDTSFYSIFDGGLICSKCKPLIKDAFEITENDKNLMRIIKHTSLISIANNKELKSLYNNSINNVKNILNKSLFNHINRNIKSLHVLEEILFT